MVSSHTVRLLMQWLVRFSLPPTKILLLSKLAAIECEMKSREDEELPKTLSSGFSGSSIAITTMDGLGLKNCCSSTCAFAYGNSSTFDTFGLDKSRQGGGRESVATSVSESIMTAASTARLSSPSMDKPLPEG